MDPEHHITFEKLLEYLEQTDECQFTIAELQSKMNEYLPENYPPATRHRLQEKLQQVFGSRILVTSVPGENAILTLHR